MTQKIILQINSFITIKFFFIKKHINTLKVALQYLFNAFILFKIVFKLKPDFKLKINLNILFKTLKKFGKPAKILKKRVASINTANKFQLRFLKFKLDQLTYFYIRLSFSIFLVSFG